MIKFRLEKVLAHRQALESVAQQKLAQALQRERDLQQMLIAAQERLEASDEEFEGRKRDGVDADELLLYQGQRDRLVLQMADLQRRCDEAALEVDSRRAALVSASMDKRLLEKLKEKKAEESRVESLHKDLGVLDEIAIQKFHGR